jgi:hypothetical protein
MATATTDRSRVALARAVGAACLALAACSGGSSPMAIGAGGAGGISGAGGTTGAGGIGGVGGAGGGSIPDAGADHPAGGGAGGAVIADGGSDVVAGRDGSGAGGSGAGGTGGAGGATAASYDQIVLADHPVGYWAMTRPAGGGEPDLSGNGHAGTYKGGTPGLVSLPNGDQAADFNGSSQYLTIPSSASFSIPTTGNLTWEGWVHPDVLQFPNVSSDGYVDWMGKCADYGPTCEWEARMYDTTNPQNRCNRLSAYVFNPSAGLGSGADWQPTCGLLQAGEWLHVVGEYTTATQPSGCTNTAMYPGSINIWVDGIPWSQSSHNPTGCFSQYNVVPQANDSPINVGSMAMDTWFQGAVGKVAIYSVLLTQAQITNHYEAMTGKQPSGSCGNTCTRN